MFRKTQVKAGFHSQRGGEGGGRPSPLLGRKNRKSADRRSPINENTAAVCGRTVARRIVDSRPRLTNDGGVYFDY